MVMGTPELLGVGLPAAYTAAAASALCWAGDTPPLELSRVETGALSASAPLEESGGAGGRRELLMGFWGPNRVKLKKAIFCLASS